MGAGRRGGGESVTYDHLGDRGGSGEGGEGATYNHLSDHDRARTTPAYAVPVAVPVETTTSSRSLTVAYYSEAEDGQGATASQPTSQPEVVPAGDGYLDVGDSESEGASSTERVADPLGMVAAVDGSKFSRLHRKDSFC